MAQLTLAASKRSAGEVYSTYSGLYYRAGRRMAQRISLADPRVGIEQAAHLCQNWGSEAGRAELARGRKLEQYIITRRDREYARAEHEQHSINGEAGRYHWCRYC